MKIAIGNPKDDEEREYWNNKSVKAIANNEAMIEMGHQKEEAELAIKCQSRKQALGLNEIKYALESIKKGRNKT